MFDFCFAFWNSCLHKMKNQTARFQMVCSNLVCQGRIFIYLVFGIMLIIICIPFMMLSKNINLRILSPIAFQMARFIGIGHEIRRRSILVEGQKGVVIANHQQPIEIVALLDLMMAMPRCTLVVKRVYSLLGPLAVYLWLNGGVFLNSSNAQKSYMQLKKLGCLARKEGMHIIIYPEGKFNWNLRKTRSLLPFKRGAFRSAIEWQMPIIPIVTSPIYLLEETYGKGTIVSEVLDPIPTKGLTEDDIEDLMERTKEIMQKKYDNLAKEMERKYAC